MFYYFVLVYFYVLTFNFLFSQDHKCASHEPHNTMHSFMASRALNTSLGAFTLLGDTDGGERGGGEGKGGGEEGRGKGEK